MSFLQKVEENVPYLKVRRNKKVEGRDMGAQDEG
jgi:hypothetical protein